MLLKNILLFIIVCALDGVFIFLGSVLGHGAGNTGLFAGAIIGGIVGVAVATWLAVRLGLLDRVGYWKTFCGGVVGFIVAAVIAVKNLHGPLIPMASVGLIGVGALIGKVLGHKRTT